MFSKKPDCEVQPIIDFIKAHPLEFEISQYTIKHKTTDLKIWIGNAPDNYGFCCDVIKGTNKFSNESQPIFHKFIEKFMFDRLEVERKENVAAKMKMLINS